MVKKETVKSIGYCSVMFSVWVISIHQGHPSYYPAVDIMLSLGAVYRTGCKTRAV